MKKIFFVILFFIFSFSQTKPVSALTPIGCPKGYCTAFNTCAEGYRIVGKDQQCAGDYACCPLYNSDEGANSGVMVGKEVTSETLKQLNPLYQSDPKLAEELSTPGGIINRFIQNYAFPLAGLILFVMLVWGGFEMLSGAANKKSIDAGKQRITAAVIGFVLLFAAYWIIQIIEAMFGLSIL